MFFRNTALLDAEYKTVRPISVGIKNGIIDYIGNDNEKSKDYGEVFDGEGYLLTPAFCSAHSHSAMTLFRGVGGDKPLSAWLNESIFPLEAKLTEKDIYNGTLAACAEMLKYGVVCCNDMYFKPVRMAKAYIDSHMKADVSASVSCFEYGKKLSDLPIYGDILQIIDFLKGNEKVKADMAIHSEYINTALSASTCVEFAHEHGMGIHLHLSETTSEHDDCIKRHGLTPAAFFKELGAFDGRAIAAHCVQCTQEDYEILAEKGVYMASCPTSNLKLGSGIPNYMSALSKGVKVCLGTDGVASNNNLNMVKEAKLMALLSKGLTRDASVCPARTAVMSATRMAWLSAGRDSGVIEIGKPADLAVFDISSVNTALCRDGADTLIYACDGEAYMTLCDGEVLYRNGEYTTIDKEKLIYEIENI